MFVHKSHLFALSLFVILSTGLKAEDKVIIFDKKQPDSELTVLGFTIGKSTLDEVKAKFKSKEFHHESDTASGIKILCFKTNGSTMAFESGEKGRTDNVITSISINSSQQSYRLDKICEKTSLIKSKLAINNVSLGMSTDLIKKVKGLPSSSTPELIIYQYETKERATSIFSNLNIRFKDNAVSSITATKIENNSVLQ
jgi:hypothetical protein